MLANGGQLDGRRVLGRKTIELMTVNHLPGGATLQDLAVGGFGEAGFEGVGFGLGFAVGLGPAATAMAGLGRRVLLGRRGQHGLLGRPGRGPLRRLHDPALPLHRLPVPGPAARARVPGHRRLMSRAAARGRPVAPVPSARPTPASSPASPGRPPSPACRRPTRCRSWDIAVVGVPFDGGTSYRPGARFGPAAVRQGSRLLRPYNPAARTPCPSSWPRWSTPATSRARPSAPRRRWRRSRPAAEALLDGGGRLVAIGGDHTVALPLLRATAARHGPLALVHFDAHLDTWDTYFGQRFTHGTPFRRAWEEGLLLRDHSMHVGLRGPLYSGTDLRRRRRHGLRAGHDRRRRRARRGRRGGAAAGAGRRRAALRVGRHRRPRPRARAGHRDARGRRADQPRAAGAACGGWRPPGSWAPTWSRSPPRTTTPRSRRSRRRTCSTSWSP